MHRHTHIRDVKLNIMASLTQTIQNAYVWLLENLRRKPETVWSTDGTTGLLGLNRTAMTTNWQLTELDMSKFKYIRAYFKCSDADSGSTALTAAYHVDISFDDISLATGSSQNKCYLGSNTNIYPNNNNRTISTVCAIDPTKTKFQVVHQTSNWGITTSDANDHGRYCYKLEGFYN